jgi:hypothetical protein
MNKLCLLTIILITLIFQPAEAVFGVDVSQPYSTAVYQCMANNGA